MKRRQDGYVMAYVMVVILLLFMAAATVCSVALRNVKSQQASLAQMQSQYEAEGKIERFVGKLQDVSAPGEGATEDAAAEEAKTALKNAIASAENWPDDSVDSVTAFVTSEGAISVTACAKSRDGAVSVKAVINVAVDFVPSDETPAPEGELPKVTATVAGYTYQSYEITYGGNGGDGA